MKRKIKKTVKKRLINGSLAIVLALTTVPLNIFPHSAKAAGIADSTVKLRFMETTDLHDNIMDYDYYQDKPTIDFGLDRTAKLITEARSEVNNSMLFDAGDLLQGNPMADYVAKIKKLGVGETHPMFKAMDLLKYDAGIVGNHEFNYGLPFLDNALKKAPYKVVNANIYIDDHDNDPTNDKNYFKAYEILDKKVVDEAGNEQTIKVGVIGFAPPQIMQWDKDNLTGKVIIKDIVKTAKEFIPKMRAEGADVIVAIAHSGCDIEADGQEEAENAVYSLSKVSGIDALLFGHAHLNFPGDSSFNGKTGIDNITGKINNVPAMEAGYWGNNLGVMDLELQKVDGKWKVADSKAALRPLTKTVNGTKVSTVDGPDQTIVDAVKDTHEGTLAYVRGKIGETTSPMFSYFSRVMDDPTIQVVNNAQTDYAKKYISQNLPELKDVPVISAGAPFKAGRQGTGDYTNIAKGDLSIKSANDLYLYNNTFKAVELTGAEVKEWLEMSAAQFHQIDPNKAEAQELIDYGFQPYNFDVIDGVKYQIDVTKPARYNYTTGDIVNANSHRIINFTMMDGTPIKDNQKFIVATNNYRASGGGNFPGTKGGKAKVVIDSPLENREILMNYLSDEKVVNPTADNNWKIAPVGGVAKLVFRSSPDAIPFAKASKNVKDVGPQVVNEVTWEQFSLDQTVHVQLLGINDFHGQLDTWKTNKDAQGNVTSVVGGIEYLAAYLKDREATNPSNTLMIQAGDLVGASPPVSALLQDEPTIRFMNEIGLDVGTIGNHEFDEGVAEMMRLINGGSHEKTKQYEEKYGKFTGADMKYTVANVVDEKTNEPILPPYVVKEVDGVKIGFIGVVTTSTPTIVIPSGVAGVKFTDEVTAINKYTKELKDQGIKSIVVLAHNAGSSKTDGTGATGDVVDISKKVDPEVDVIFGAHDHAYLNAKVKDDTGKEKLLVQAYSYGQAFSDVNLTIDPVTKDIIASQAEIVMTDHAKITPDAKVKAKLDGYQEDIKPIVSKPVGETGAELSKTANTDGESVLGNVIADGMRTLNHTDFAFMNSGGIRNPVPQGVVTWGDLFKVQPFGNDNVTLTITGDQVRILLNQQFQAPPSYNKIMAISGLRYTWTDKNDYGKKVLDIYLPNGKKIDPKAEYSITVNNFMADGGDGFTVLLQGKNRVTAGVDLDQFVEYFKTLPKGFTAGIEGRIKQLSADTTAPDAPEVDIVTDKSTKVTGTTEALAKVEVKANGNVIGTANAEADGKFSVSITAQKAGTELVVTATNALGNVSDETKVTVKDVTAPAAPLVDAVTNKTTKVTGTTEALAKVEVKAKGTVIGTATAGANGKYSVTITAQKAGTELVVTATDAAGNVSEETKVTVKDVTAPAAPEVYEVTNLDTYIMGTAEPGSTVEAKVGNKVIGTTVAEKDGYFEIEIEAQKVGTVITVTAKNAAGNVSKATTVTVEQYIGWYYDEDGYHYINPKTGVEMTNSWLKEDGVWYHFNNKGILETGWVKVNGKWYFFSDDDETFGEMQTGWYKENNKWYFLDQVNGDMKVNWAKVGGKWYFFNKSGVMQTGWVKDGKTWYYLASSGAMQTGWIKEGKTWYYLANSGAMQSGWVKVNNKWYYLAASGAMKTGWVQVGAKWYYLYNDGSMAANTTIGKYKLGKDGAWIK